MTDIFYFLKQLHSISSRVLYWNLIGMITMSLLEGIGILILIPMISFSGIIDLKLGESTLTNLFSIFNNLPSSFGLPIILGIYVVIVVLQSLLKRQINIRNVRIRQGFLRHIRVQTYHYLLHSNWSFFLKNRRSDLINLLKKEISKVNTGINSIVQFLTSFVFTIIQICLALWISSTLTIFVLLCGCILLLLNKRFLTLSKIQGHKNLHLGRDYLAGITDHLNGIKEIKSNNLEKARMDWYQSITQEMMDEQVKYAKVRENSSLIYQVASAILIAIFIFVAVNIFSAQGAQLMLIILIFSRLWPTISGIQASLEKIANAMPSFQAVRELQHKCQQALEYINDSETIRKSLRMNLGIECRNVSFRYNLNEDVYALKNINLVIPANQMTAIVGRSGAGKSTLIDLLMGLNQPETGKVYIDGMDLTRENLISFRRSISYVPQDPFLFNTSVRENFLLVEPNANEDQIWKALSFANADEFVRKLPNGLDTIIGDRGIKLSGGERQRLVLARAILRKPSILVLDEATSALDSDNEAKIQEALERIKGTMTIIVIAHRLSTIRNADQVVVLEKGEIIQKGSFIKLAQEKRSVFSQLLAKQLEAIH
jgi:ABC-type multidrug transport system fused ATPase/permease subunit